MFQKIYLLIFLIIYFIIVFIVPSIRVKRKTGINPYVFKKTDSAHDFLGKVSTPITLLIFIVTLVDIIYPTGLQYLGPFLWLDSAIFKGVGFLLIHVTLLWIVVAQLQMSNSWRVGIDHTAQTELKTNGLFSVSRNPVFLGMLITLASVFLIIPNAITLLVVIVSVLLFQVQVRLEEEYLLKIHGDSYKNYCQKARRWF